VENVEGEVSSAAFAASPLTGTFPLARKLSSNASNSENINSTTEAAPAAGEANREDELLVQQVLSGNADAFARLIDRYKVAVYNLCARMLHDQDEAEDASQEVFLRAYNQLHTYQPGRRFSTWILSIASHYCIDLLRRRRPVMDLDSIAFWKASDQPEPEETAVAAENRDEVRELLKKIPEKYRSVTILRYWQDLSYEEIAEATGLSVATVKTRLFRARELLAKELEKQRKNGGDAGSRSREEKKFFKNRASLTEGSKKSKNLRGSQNVLP
jgi:RNA polymerase sigma-70 factor (ECF subfamily)